MPQPQITLEEAQEIQRIYLPIPHLFVKDVLGCKTWHMQDEITKSVFANKVTAVKTCNAVGKSFIAARIVATYLTLLPGSVVVTTAPTWRQVTDVLWREVATAIKQSKYKLTDNEVRQAGLDIAEDWFAVGLSTKYPENFFGYHADNILVVVDEAGGVPEPIFKGVKAITPNANARILYIGNPTNPSGTFYEAFTNMLLPIKRFTISAFDSPNFTACGIRTVEDLLRIFTAKDGYDQATWIEAVNRELTKRMDPTFAALIAPSVVFERYHEWGPDSPAWESLVMGEFPSQAEQSLIPVDLVKGAMNLTDRMVEYTDPASGITSIVSQNELDGWKVPTGEVEYGLDMARYGSDRCVLTPRRGGYVDQQVLWGKVSLIESANRVIKIIDPYKRTRINIDDTGNGGGTTDSLNHQKGNQGDKASWQYKVIPFNFSSKEQMSDDDREKFHDVTSMLYWNLREQFMEKKISLHYDKELFDELIARRWSITPAGKIKVESKDEYRKRTGGKSPDKSDSLALAFAPRFGGNWADIPLPKKQTQGNRPTTAGLINKQF